MKRILIFCALMVFIVACEGKSPSTQGKSVASPLPKVVVEKEKPEKEEALPAEVRIKLKKDGKDNYSLTPANSINDSKQLQTSLLFVGEFVA